jgi:hypothetical protein
MTESDEFFIANIAYCLTWEIGGMRASQYWQGIREFIDQSKLLSEKDRWVCELYEESSPTAQEERSILARINAKLVHPRVVLSYRQAILAILPEELAETAAKHRLMNSLTVPEGYNPIRSWLAQHKIADLSRTKVEKVPLAAREADFVRFIEHPYFLEGFRRYWHQAPKSRNNKQTRVLLCIAAALSQMVSFDDESELKGWSERLSKIGNFTEQTLKDITDLSLAMNNESYDAQELGYRLFVDAKEVDRINLTTFCNRYSEELTGFARELVRSMQIAF